MAADVTGKHPPVNSCCTVWKDKCSKLEVGRKHLRQAVQILNEQIDKIQGENAALKKAYEQEQARAETEKEGKDEELAVRVSLENEISALKSEVFSLKQKISADAKDGKGEVKLLQDHVSEAEKEITRLKSLLEEEKIRVNSEKKNAEAQKKSAAEAWKQVKTERAKADEERKLANNEGKKAEEYRLKVEDLRKEVDEAKSKLVSETLKLEEAGKKLEAEKHKLTKERKRSDLEMAKVEEQRKLAEANGKKVIEETSRAESLSQQLRVATQRVEELQKEINSIVLSRDLDEAPGWQCNKSEISVFNYQISSLRRKESLDIIKDKTGNAIVLQDHFSEEEKVKEINKLKELLQKEKERADSLKKTAEAEKKSASEAQKRMISEKAKADEERKKSEGYWVQLEALRKEADETKVKLMSEILKFEDANKRLVKKKHRVAKERKCNASEKAKSKELTKLAETNGKRVIEGKTCAGNLPQKLQVAGKRMEELKKEINTFLFRSSGRSPSDLNSNAEAAKMRFMCCLDNFIKDVDHAELVLELLKFEAAFKRFEVEKQDAVVEKNHTDMKLMEVEKLKQLVEVNRKMALEEKSRADQLSCQLAESRHKIEELQKQIKELFSYKRVVEASAILPSKDVKNESRKLKLLEKRLKLEKMRLKYAKEVAKLEKIRRSTLQQELSRIRVDSNQISQHLDALDKWFSSGIECREVLEKDGVSVNMQRSKLKRKFGDLEPFHKHVHKESELKPSCMAVAACSLSQSLYRKAPLLPIRKGQCIESLSSFDSKLKALHEGSYHNLLQSSDSRSASFSDSKLLDSQEMGAFVSTSEKWMENSDGQTTISGMSSEVTKKQCNPNLAVVAESNIRSSLGIDTSGRVNGQSRKWKKMVDAIESVESLYSEGKKLNVQMEEKLSLLHGMLNREIEKPLDELDELKYVEALGGSYAKHERGHKRKAPCDERIIMQHSYSVDKQEKIARIEHEVHGDVNNCKHASPSPVNLFGVPQDCIKELNDSYGTDLAIIARVEEVEDGAYMKLLDLDNTADEECYRRALEMPLSPNLPEIEISTAEISDANKFEAGNVFQEGLSNEKGIEMPSHNFDVETSPNNLRCNASGTSRDELILGNEGVVNSFGMFDNANGCCNSTETERASDRETGGDSEVLKIANLPTSRVGGLKLSSESKLEYVHANVPTYCMVFSNTKDCSSVSRIFSATRTCIAHCSLNAEIECNVKKILDVIKMEELLPKEKACAFFTVMLLNISVTTSRKPGCFLDKDFVLFIDSFARQINSVVSDVDARSLAAGLCCMDELLDLIEDFLINGQVMVLADVSFETLSESDSRMDIFLDGVNVNISSKPASAYQLVAGSIILASICKALDRVEFICEASYDLLRVRKYDTGVLLTILHVFAYLGGNKFFSLKEYSLTVAVLKSIIFFLEGGNASAASASSCFSSLHEVGLKFQSCANCPFDAVSVDVVASMLMEMLQGCALSGTMHQHCMELANLSNSHAKQNLSAESVSCALHVNCDASCGTNKCVMPADANCGRSGTLCFLSDVLSLVELLAGYMTWEWTCGKIIPVLLEILERPMLDDFAVAVVVHLGQLGRIGVAACGYKDEEVENLKCKLSGFLLRDSTNKASFPVQIAAITSLLGLVSLNFEDVIQSDLKLPEVASQSVSTDLIRNWFSSLSKEQQTFSRRLLQSAAVVTR